MEVLTNIGFDWQVALANFVSFLLIFGILKKWVFGPVGEIIKKRQDTIEEGVNKAEMSEQALEEAQAQAQDIVKESKAEANEIIAKAKTHGDELVTKATTKAQQEADAVVTKAQESIEKEKQNMERELLEKTAGLVSLGVQKILQEDVDDQKNQDLTNRALNMFKEGSVSK